MAKAISENDNRNLWAEAKKIKKSNNSIPNVMDNTSGSDNINYLFSNKFEHLYNSVGFDEKDLDSLRSKLDEKIRKEHSEFKLKDNNKICVTVSNVRVAISKLKSNKKRRKWS